ncbi:aldo/keto reductase [Flammeovirga yaeyamensis]|uniref:Aldo/keto reductase n=1 Tax=Flammeovirga yaeyamensis TaxID=367791 RepID=A0AAX1N217_9BACT|nr:aldo/keto reductase [Flammeovirga yaeyamensis]MBB3696071.1 aryl-alcohol dehydrogenase-like predicted oxidoreductase [Flammeovirga yaeyamensis]NMF34756.1 aldo/keto reductase [Flammeovirga yaeyamensis]QWG00416.1 aldo/keto reductase [Flammeovirga yaeyamensis]
MKYKILGNTGLKVSELCLGTMTFGEDWGTGANKEVSKKIFDAFVDKGGNFFDTANFYTNGTSEKFLGEFIQQERDHHIVATKYTLIEDPKHPNGSGNSRRNMMNTVEASLKRLNTDYIDVLWLHMWDNTTPIEDILRGMNDLISQGKVAYIGISDTPAWVVSKGNTYAQSRGWEPFSAIQVEHSLIAREVERELLPMSDHYGMSVLAWAPLGAGILSGKYNKGMIDQGRLSEQSVKFTEHNIKIAQKVEEIANGIGATTAQVALKWLMQKNKKVIPIIGARKVEQVNQNLGVLDIQLTDSMMEELNEISKIDLGFPNAFLQTENALKYSFGGWHDKIDF